MIRKATSDDVSRIAEILIFAKRTAYRPIFQNDRVSFNEMQVVPLAASLLKDGALEDVAVYDDGIVKGMLRRGKSAEANLENCIQIFELYIEPFFQGGGVGSTLMQSLLDEARALKYDAVCLWVLEKNRSALAFYERFGFSPDGKRKPEQGTDEYLIRYVKYIKMG
jgi:putative acetyltransferase